MMDAGDVYSAGLHFELIPILSEVYNLGKPEYYVVAVAKARDADTELIYLKNKNTCHTGEPGLFPLRPPPRSRDGWRPPCRTRINYSRIRLYHPRDISSSRVYWPSLVRSGGG